jgi:hypothetical protein
LTANGKGICPIWNTTTQVTDPVISTTFLLWNRGRHFLPTTSPLACALRYIFILHAKQPTTMVASNTSVILPNPHTPMAFLWLTLAVKVTNLLLAPLPYALFPSISNYLLIAHDRFSHGVSYCISLKIINWRHNFVSIFRLYRKVSTFVFYFCLWGGVDQGSPHLPVYLGSFKCQVRHFLVK